MRATTRHGHAPCPATPRPRPTACAVLWKVLWKVFCTFLQSTLYFVPSVAFVSLGPSVAFVPCVRALRSCHSPCLMFSSSPRTVASGKRGGHPSNRAPPTPDVAFRQFSSDRTRARTLAMPSVSMLVGLVMAADEKMNCIVCQGATRLLTCQARP